MPKPLLFGKYRWLPLSDETRIERANAWTEADLGDELVLMHIETGRFFSLRGTGRQAWEKLEVKISFGELVARMREEHAVGADQCRAELQDLLMQLSRHGFIVFSRTGD